MPFCPICRKPVDGGSVGTAGSTFPFCGPRCRDIDLGRWLDGKYQIPVLEDDEMPPGSTSSTGGRGVIPREDRLER